MWFLNRWSMQVHVATDVLTCTMFCCTAKKSLHAIARSAFVKFRGSHSSIPEDSLLLGYDAAPMDCRNPTFRGNVVTSSSRAEISKTNVLCSGTFRLLRIKTALPRCVGKELTSMQRLIPEDRNSSRFSVSCGLCESRARTFLAIRNPRA